MNEPDASSLGYIHLVLANGEGESAHFLMTFLNITILQTDEVRFPISLATCFTTG